MIYRMFWLAAVFICLLMMCNFIPVLVRRILILVYTQLTVIWIELTVELRQMDYALIPQSPNVLCIREPMFFCYTWIEYQGK